jgi:RND family efflux transporter MFP subunit
LRLSGLKLRLSTFRIPAILRGSANKVDNDNLRHYEVVIVNMIDHWSSEEMRPFLLLFTVLLVLAGCKPEDAPATLQLVRALVVDPRVMEDDRHVIGEIRPRYESDLSFRVGGKVLARLVDVGASVKKGATLAILDTQDYQNRLRSAEADVSSAEAALVNAQGTEARQAKLLQDGWTPKATYDTALQNLQATEARLKAAKASLDLARDQLNYTTLKADFDGVITAVGAEAGQNVNAGQMVAKLAQPDEKDSVFHVAETALSDISGPHVEIIVWPLVNSDLTVEGIVREISPVADPVTRTYTIKATLNNPPSQLRFGMSVGGRLKGKTALAVALPLSALFEKNGSPAVWVLDQQSSSLSLKPITVARYELDTAIVASGLNKGDTVVIAGVNRLTVGQKVRVADADLARSDSK